MGRGVGAGSTSGRWDPKEVGSFPNGGGATLLWVAEDLDDE